MPFIKPTTAKKALQNMYKHTDPIERAPTVQHNPPKRPQSKVKQQSILEMNEVAKCNKPMKVIQELPIAEQKHKHNQHHKKNTEKESSVVSVQKKEVSEAKSVMHQMPLAQQIKEIQQLEVDQPMDKQAQSFLQSLPRKPINNHQSVPQESSYHTDLSKLQKLMIKPQEISLEPQSKRMLTDFNDEKTMHVVSQMVNGTVNYDVRRLQTALFVSQINASVTDFHKNQLSADISSSLPHYLWLSLWGCLIGSGITLLIVFNQVKNLLNYLSVMFYIFIVLEYSLMFAALKTGQYSEKPQLLQNESTKVEKGKVCLIVPVGWGIRGLTESQKEQRKQNKIDVLTNTLVAALDVFESSDIFVFHNSSDQELPDQKMMECCKNKGIYVPINIGSKSVSAYYGAMLGDWLGYQYVIVMDDDTRLPKELGKILNQPLDCDAYCMAIAAASNEDYSQIPNGAKLLIGLQDIEYKLSDLSKLVQYNFTNTSSVLAPHGAINMWRTEILVDIMKEHNCIFHGEDYQMGLIMRNRHKGKRLGIISNCIVSTVAPSTLKDLFMQRYTSWDLAAQQFLWGGFCASQRSAHYMQVLFCLPCTIDNILIRVFTLEDVWTVLQDYLRVLLLAYHIIMSIVYGYLNVTVMVMYLVVLGSQWVIAWSLQYVKFKGRPDLQIPKDMMAKTVALFPIYRFCFSFVRVAALLRFFLKFESVKRNAHPIKQMSLPQPKEIDFAFSGLRKSVFGKEKIDSQMIQEVVAQTLNQAKYQVRQKDALPAIIRNRSQAEKSEQGLSQLVPKQEIPKHVRSIEPSIASSKK